MIRKEDSIIIKAIVICHKTWLKPEEAQIYCNLGRTQLAKKCEEYHVYKSNSGYYKKEELDRMLSGIDVPISLVSKK